MPMVSMVDPVSIITGLRLLVPAMYLLVTIGYVLEFIKNRSSHFFWIKPAFIAGIFFHLLLLVALFFRHHHVPFDTIFTGLLFISLIISLFYSGMEHFIGERRYGAFIFPVNFILTCIAVRFLDYGKPLPPALHSVYFVTHVTLLFLAYACFFLSFVIAIMYLLQHRQIKNHRMGNLFIRLPSLAEMDQTIMRVDGLGLGLLIVGMAMGFLWIEMVTGVPSRMSLKIILSVLTALVYLSEHFMRIGKGWNGQRACWISIAGFLCIIFTILAGRHGY